MVHYDKSIIYKICCKDVNVKGEYVGSTTNFQRRKGEHKYSCIKENNKKYNLNVYAYIREHGGWDAFDMVEVERYPATDKANLHTRERYWIETLKAELNGKIPTRSLKEYYNDNIGAILKNKKEYYETNKESINEQKKKRYKDNKESIIEQVTCECGSVVTKGCLTRHKKSQKHIRLSPPCSPLQI
jgi:hypothetical protein